jgi:23S rRNA pseudouridine1911/1915/1917 synthase
METIKIKATIQGERVDKFLTNYLQADFDFSRSLVQKYILDGHVKANGEVVTNNYNVLLDDEIEIMIPEPENLDVKGEDIPFEILFEDDDLIVLNKPNNLVVHPAPGNQSGTLVNALIYKMKKLSSISGVLRPGIVHRLDKLTTGLMIVAKSDTAHKKIVEMLKKGEIKKIYRGIVHGVVNENKGRIEMPIGRHGGDRKKMAVTGKNSKHAITNFTVLERFAAFTYVEFDIETGRTHQIRVHMSAIGHPILGDPLYASKADAKEEFGQYLHSYQIEFVHPITNKKLSFKCEPPQTFIDRIKELEK